MRNLDPALVSKRGLGAFTYQVVTRDVRPRPHASAEADLSPPRRHVRTCSTAMRDWGLPVEPHWRRCDGIDDVVAFCQEWADKRPDARLRHRRRRHQGRRPGAARAARRDGEVSALGDRVQVSRAAGAHEAAPDRRQRRPDRRGDAVRRARAGAPRRLHDLDGDAAQRAGRRAQGHPRRRHRRHREGRRRHPEGRRADPQPAAAGPRGPG